MTVLNNTCAGTLLRGTGDDGSPLLSYSTLCALYQLPDGSKWAEHIDYYDMVGSVVQLEPAVESARVEPTGLKALGFSA